MLCKKPFMKGVIPCGCGNCTPCRINRSRLWSGRLLLEQRAHVNSTFVTLTYRDEEVSDVSGAEWNASRPVLGNLVLEDAQKWLKRLRKAVGTPIRYFLVGEYGDETQRPHYHAAIFGLPNCIYGRTRPRVRVCCGPCDVVGRTWDKGRVQLGELNSATAQYISGYVTKKWTKEDSWTKEKLKGRRPEFARMSLKPGIGATAVKNLINFTGPTRSGKAVSGCLDAPVVLRNGGSTLPLGRYLRRKWREALGRDPDAPESVLGQYCEEMQRLYQEAKAVKLAAGVPSCFITPASVYESQNKQKIKNLDARIKIKQSRRPL